MMAIPVDKVSHIISLNKKGKMPAELEKFAQHKEQKGNVEKDMEDNFASFI
jgi:hypothetical protein